MDEIRKVNLYSFSHAFGTIVTVKAALKKHKYHKNKSPTWVDRNYYT